MKKHRLTNEPMGRIAFEVVLGATKISRRTKISKREAERLCLLLNELEIFLNNNYLDN